jgi:NADH-quinone oxidoreductase subunit B
MHGVLKLRKMVQDDPDMGWRDRYDARGTEEVLPASAERSSGRAVAVNVADGESIEDTAGA